MALAASLLTPFSAGQGINVLAKAKVNATRNVVENIDLEMVCLLEALIYIMWVDKCYNV